MHIMKKIIGLVVVMLAFASCGNQSSKKEVNKEELIEKTVDVVRISPDEFADKAASLVGKQIEITGTVDHTCKHGGKKMVIYGKNADKMVKLMAGESIDKFDSELEGQKVVARGVVNEFRMDEEYLQNWEKEVADHHGENDEEYKEDMEQIAHYRAKMKADSTDHISFYSIMCESYKPTEENK